MAIKHHYFIGFYKNFTFITLQLVGDEFLLYFI